MKKLILLSVLLVFLVGCGPAVSSGNSENNEPVITVENLGRGVWRFIDREANVVCWEHDGNISCLSYNDTTLYLHGH
jgi:hypothetical protein